MSVTDASNCMLQSMNGSKIVGNEISEKKHD